MATPFKLSDWNGIITDVNNKIDDCDCELPYLPLADSNHLWSAADIVAMRTTLQNLCIGSSPTFTAPLVKWSQAIVDELQTAISQCSCISPGAPYFVTWYISYSIAYITGRLCWTATLYKNGSYVDQWNIYANLVQGVITRSRTYTMTLRPGDTVAAGYVTGFPPTGSSFSTHVSITPA
jgi:hypothetical protein